MSNEVEAKVNDLAQVKQALDLHVVGKLRQGRLPQEQVNQVAGFLDKTTEPSQRREVNIFILKPGSPSGGYDEKTGAVTVGGEGAPTFQIVWPGGQEPEEFVERHNLGDIYERHQAVLEYEARSRQDQATLDNPAAHPFDPSRPPDPLSEDGQKRLRASFEEALADTRIGEDKEARQMILASAKDARALDEVEVHTVLRRRPGVEKINLEDGTTFIEETMIRRWPEEPGLPRLDPSSGVVPDGAAAVVTHTRTLRTIAADLHERARLRYFHRPEDAEALLAPRRRLFH